MRVFPAEIGVSFGFLSAPDAPTLSVVDGGDADSAVASVTGTGTIQLYYRLKTESDWTTGETRTGDGDITQTGLTASKWYEFYATATDGGTSGPSSVETVHIAGTDDNTIETSLYSILSGDGDVTDKVSTRIYPVLIPQKADMPAIAFQQISADREYTMAGEVGMTSITYQVSCFADSYSESRELADVVRIALSDYSGTVNGRYIYTIFIQGEGDIPNISPEFKRYGKRLDFEVWFKEQLS